MVPPVNLDMGVIVPIGLIDCQKKVEYEVFLKKTLKANEFLQFLVKKNFKWDINIKKRQCIFSSSLRWRETLPFFYLR